MAALLAACGNDGGPNMMPDGGMGGDGGGQDTPPTTRFLATPLPGQTNGVLSAFELGCDEAACTFECSLDGGAFAPCDASVSFGPLSPGSYSLAVRATDASGNVETEPQVHEWTLGFGYRSVVANGEAACAISGEGGLYCWGTDANGLLGDGPTEAANTATPTRVGTESDWEELFAGRESFCGRRAGALYCWGYDYALGDQQSEDPLYSPTLLSSTLVSLQASYNAACGLDAAGALYCVGDGEDGLQGDGITADGHYVATLTRVGTDTYTQVAVGDDHACAIRADGRILCWGRQPVIDTVLAVPTLGTDTSTWRRVTIGEEHACAIKTNGELYCWGENYDGQLGLGDFDSVVEPTRVGTDSDWVEVSAGESGTCALKSDGRGFCWGSNYNGQLGSLSAPMQEVNTPTLVSTTVGLRTISGTADTQCAQSELGEALCWGRNDSGLLGRGVLPNQATMTLIDDQFDRIATTPYGGCGLASGSLLCWGSTQPNGDPNGLPRATPTAVTADTDWTHVSISTQYAGHACGIRAGALYCWGNNNAGQLGTGDTTTSLVPVQVAAVSGVTGWKHVSAGVQATCAVATNGNLYCWGSNSYGHLGVGDTEPRMLPTQVALSNWDTVEMGNYRTGARRTDGSFYYWGVNAGPSPTQVTGTDWALVDDAGFGECGIKTDGTLHCTLQAVAGAFQAGTATNWVSIVSPGFPYCALDSQGAVGCFVNNGSNNGFTSSPAIAPGSGWSQLAGDNSAMCGLRNGTERHCRGYRNLGSLGDGFDERVPTPVLAP
jgi:alpha-tubulin suppressor-like RCC1 family protein